MNSVMQVILGIDPGVTGAIAIYFSGEDARLRHAGHRAGKRDD